MATQGEMEDKQLFEAVASLVQEYLASCQDRESKVIDFKQPEELRSLIDLSLRDEGESDETILELCRKALQYSVHTAHPRFYNQLFSGVDVGGLCGVLLATAANTSVYTFEMAPVFGLMETEVLQKMCSLIGWHRGNGIFAPGGSISNLYGLIAARYHKFPETKEKGTLHLPQMVVFASDESHYSIKKIAVIMGLGTDNIIPVKCDHVGRMDVSDLERAVQEAKGKGQVPLAVVGTSATTVLGAFDPLTDIARVCKKYDIWLHVDAALGGSVLVSRTHRHLASGIDQADSIAWNPHKTLNVPLQCSAFLTRHCDLLHHCLSVHATYLFQKDKMLYDVSLDTGDMSIQCGRLNDALKIWLMWKRGGMLECERRLDRRMQLASYLREQVKKKAGFQLVVEEQQYTNVSFWYIPPCLRSCADDLERKKRLNKVAPRIKAAMVLKGSMMIGYQPLRDLPNFFRMVIAAPGACEADMDFVLEEIERLGEGLQV